LDVPSFHISSLDVIESSALDPPANNLGDFVSLINLIPKKNRNIHVEFKRIRFQKSFFLNERIENNRKCIIAKKANVPLFDMVRKFAKIKKSKDVLHMSFFILFFSQRTIPILTQVRRFKIREVSLG
jgi:hypothetical protein